MSEKILSVFIDESGDFGPYEVHAPYYLVAMVLHDQTVDISANIAGFETHLRNLGYAQHAVHTRPLIRRESVYANDLMENRKQLFNALFHFSRKLDIRYTCVKIKKNECPDVIAMTAKLSKGIANVLRVNEAFWNSFDRVIVYYDNGQIELTKILISVFSTLYAHVEFRKVRPVDYKLFQVADFICTLELLSEKADSGTFSASEMEFFENIRCFKKNYLKHISKKHL
ncbi:DUF3800 domain-containing protein [Lacrimispora sp. 210928-DFI.3.58]|uniref:DUF3800 domain-containing protein n=1 Tax=Lacrimispora sp. 210928-DFI.3.58 TaxID=2883214 RepID=UPI0015B4B8EA|nr:DUF3800 domain-containing protein [Lacrimispora sp. 210928-DFI.3.58]MCB7320116.1 DUF3800 domain-containing protein [Lacrimispora sp. 210928-DFI.3.58]